MVQCGNDVTSRVQGESISTPRATSVRYSRYMQHIITSSTAPVRMRVEPARRAQDQFNSSEEDSLSGFKGIAVGLLLSVALWALLIGLYFLI